MTNKHDKHKTQDRFELQARGKVFGLPRFHLLSLFRILPHAPTVRSRAAKGSVGHVLLPCRRICVSTLAYNMAY